VQRVEGVEVREAERAQFLGGEEGARQRFAQVVAGRRVTDDDVRGQRGLPRIELRRERRAVRTGVGEDLDFFTGSKVPGCGSVS